MQDSFPIRFHYSSCIDLDKRPDKGVAGSSMLQVPVSMISLDLLVAASSYIDKWGLVDVGQLGPAVRLAWLVPSRTEQLSPLHDHWKVFRAVLKRIFKLFEYSNSYSEY